MLECIYEKQFGGKLRRFLCCHSWSIKIIYINAGLRIEKNRCVDCDRQEILILVEHTG